MSTRRNQRVADPTPASDENACRRTRGQPPFHQGKPATHHHMAGKQPEEGGRRRALEALNFLGLLFSCQPWPGRLRVPEMSKSPRDPHRPCCSAGPSPPATSVVMIALPPTGPCWAGCQGARDPRSCLLRSDDIGSRIPKASLLVDAVLQLCACGPRRSRTAPDEAAITTSRTPWAAEGRVGERTYAHPDGQSLHAGMVGVLPPPPCTEYYSSQLLAFSLPLSASLAAQPQPHP